MLSSEVKQAVVEIRAQAEPVEFSDAFAVLTNLVFAYQVIVASERLLQEAAQEASGGLRDYYLTHLEEERDHQAWLAEDLASFGLDVKSINPMRHAIAMTGSQYYLIKHVDPSCLLGYMAVLEGFPVTMEWVEAIEAMHGKPIMRTMRYHAEADLEHRKALFDEIDKHEHPGILMNARQTAIYLNQFSHTLNQSLAA